MPILSSARQEIRRNFDNARELAPEEVQAKMTHAVEVAKVLRTNVVQGQKSQVDDNMYDLRIHKDIERGDNETIKKAKQNPASGSGCRGQASSVSS